MLGATISKEVEMRILKWKSCNLLRMD